MSLVGDGLDEDGVAFRSRLLQAGDQRLDAEGELLKVGPAACAAALFGHHREELYPVGVTGDDVPLLLVGVKFVEQVGGAGESCAGGCGVDQVPVGLHLKQGVD
jgi:hypothetical protein